MKRSLALSVAVLIWTPIVIAQSKQDPTVPKWERGNSPKAKSLTHPHKAISPGPAVTSSTRTGTSNQHLSQLEHETNGIATSPAKKAPKSSGAIPRSNDTASSKHQMNFPTQPRKSATAGPRSQSATSIGASSNKNRK
jgi:hypothetical protein